MHPSAIIIGAFVGFLANVFLSKKTKKEENDDAHPDSRPIVHGKERPSEAAGNPPEKTGGLCDGLQPDARNGLHEER